MDNSLAPIVLFVYNRPRHTRQTLESLAGNLLADRSKLYIYADGPREGDTELNLKNIAEVRRIIREKKWCGEVEIIEREFNIGLAASIIQGVSEIVNKYGQIIVLEDDLLTSSGFIEYMNKALGFYKKFEKVACISGYSFSIFKLLRIRNKTFFLRTGATWGWATWEKGWRVFTKDPVLLRERIISGGQAQDFNFNNRMDYLGMLERQINGKIDSWGICWYASIFTSHHFTVYAPHSLVVNIGKDGSGTHYNNKGVISDKINHSKMKTLRKNTEISFSTSMKESAIARKLLELYFLWFK